MALRSSVKPALAIAALLTAAAALHGVSPSTADPDGFCHIRHAWVYRTQGLFDSGFPWACFSAIRDQASDLWYGFHVPLVPYGLRVFDDGTDVVYPVQYDASLPPGGTP